MINIIVIALLFLGLQVQAMEKHQAEVQTALQNLEKKLKTSIENKQHLYQELEQLKKARSRLFDEALIKDNMPAAVALLRDGSTIGLCSMHKTKGCFQNASPLMKENVVHTIAGYVHQSENRKRLLWILVSSGNVEYAKAFFGRLPKEKHTKYLNIPVWSEEGVVEGYTPLYVATEKPYVPLATYLLELGADWSLCPLGSPTIEERLSLHDIELKPIQLNEKDFVKI